MDRDIQIQSIAERMESLPTLPSVCVRVNDLMANPNTSAAEIGAVVAHDQIVAARLLSVVNSSFYGFRHRINSVTRAMTMIGFRGLRDLMLALGALPALRTHSRHKEFDDTSFWSHAVGVAAGARATALMLRLPNPEEAFTAGLLHDLGKVAQYQFMTDDFMRLIEKAHSENEPIHRLELDRLRFCHADVGQLLARRWNFPDSLVEAITYHHHPGRAPRYAREAAMVHLADIIARAKALGDTYDARVPPVDMEAWKVLGLRKEQLPQLMAQSEIEFEKGKSFMAVIRDA